MHPATDRPTFSLSATRGVIGDLFVPRQSLYWTDFLLSMAVGGTAFFLVPRTPLFSPQQILAFVVVSLAFYRAVLFTHELAHLPRNKFRAFRLVWNLLCGIPFLMPSYVYHPHVDHHRRKSYGTGHDGEYLPLGRRPVRNIVLYMLGPLVLPLVAVLRFGVCAPLSWFSPRLHAWLHQHASTLVMDPKYVRSLPRQRKSAWMFRMQEAACFFYLVGVTVLVTRGMIPACFPLRAYLIAVTILTLNQVRTLGAHRYLNDGREMSFEEQLLDSVNMPRSLWTAELWAPLGLRYHALHHLFPTLPYHNLGAAHERLMRELPADNPYLQTERPNLRTALKELWQAARRQSEIQKRARRWSQPQRAPQMDRRGAHFIREEATPPTSLAGK